MKKIYLFLVALFACTLGANAATRVIYSQNFESESAVPNDWGSLTLPGNLTIGSDDYGKFIQFSQGVNNDRSCYNFWGQDIITAAETSSYTVKFDFSATAWGNNHTSAEFTLGSEPTASTKSYRANGNYRSNSSNWLFDLTQLDANHGGNAASATGDQVFCVNGDSANTITLTAGTFYTVECTIDTVARTVDYSIVSTTGDNVTSGNYQVPEGVNMIASGIFHLAARYSSVTVFDNIEISYETSGDFANVPSVTLVGINNHQRLYQIGIMEGETLHYTWNGGTEQTQSYADLDNGVYTWSNNPNYNPSNEGLVSDACESGTLVAWTTSGSATSEKVTTEVENDIISVPAVATAITNVQSGYSKTYTLTTDNSNVPLRPQIFIAYTFTPEGGGTTITQDNLPSGSTVTVPSKGTLELTASAFGYGSTNSTVENNIEYQQSAEYNFAHWTENEITSAGFKYVDDLTSENEGGFHVAYGRYFGYNASDSAKIVYSTIPRYQKLSSEWTDSIISGPVVFTVTPTVNVRILKGIGLQLNGQRGDDGSGSWISSLYVKVNDVKDDDVILFSQTGNYGSTSLHPLVNSLDEYLAADNAPVTDVITGANLKSGTGFGLYRISNALHRIQVMSAVTTGIKNVNVEEAEKANANAPIYTINGMRVNSLNNAPAGIYIQNGKKFVVK